MPPADRISDFARSLAEKGGHDSIDLSPEISLVSIFCPQCGRKVVGRKSDDGAIRMQCPGCKAVLYSKYHRSKRETLIRAIAQR